MFLSTDMHIRKRNLQILIPTSSRSSGFLFQYYMLIYEEYVGIMKLPRLISIYKERARKETKLTFKLAYHTDTPTICLLHACLLI